MRIMNIVVLDGHALNPGDLSWDGFKALGSLKVHDRTGADDVAARAQHADVVLTNKTPLNRETIRKLTNLKYIGVLATGYNVVNVEAAKKRNVVVTNVPAYGTESVAQHVFGLMLEHALRVSYHAYTVRKGKWSRCPDYCYWDYPLLELAGLTMGVVGYGRIGQAVVRIARGFNMNVFVHTRTQPASWPEGVEPAELDRVFSSSDFVSLHCPLTPETERMVNAQRLSLMKPTAYLINTSRGGLVDEEALARALNEKKIAGAGLDVLAEEPPDAKQPLFRARNCLITPHMAWGTRAARERLMRTAVGNLAAFLNGHPVNVVQ
jgi:glycerate dehydrogenase